MVVPAGFEWDCHDGLDRVALKAKIPVLLPHCVDILMKDRDGALEYLQLETVRSEKAFHHLAEFPQATSRVIRGHFADKVCQGDTGHHPLHG
jgi:hypothetical protein